MATERELAGIDEEIRKLEEKKEALHERWREEIAADLDAAGAAVLPRAVLLGAVLEAIEAHREGGERAALWEKSGESFLRGKRRSTHRKAPKGGPGARAAAESPRTA
jgi:hypothetical protein